jgi:signal transduction histidine kinase
VLQSSSGVAAGPVLDARTVAGLVHPVFVVRRVAGVDDPVRLLAVPVQLDRDRVAVVVGATLGDRNEALHRLLLALSLGVPVALVLATGAGWFLAGLALRPVEGLRREAAAITASGLERRLEVPRTHDEVARLATTLNDLLGRLEEAVQRERRFVDEASHELRTPLSVLKAEVDLALSKPRTAEELTAALHAVGEETDHVVRLAEDLLVLARASGGSVPTRRERVELSSLTHGLGEVEVRASGTASVDPVRLRQAVLDLVDNARRHGEPPVRLELRCEGDEVVLTVQDSGPGFEPDVRPRVFEPFVHGAGGGSGLGLSLVRAVAEGHGGTVAIDEPADGGAKVVLRLPVR